MEKTESLKAERKKEEKETKRTLFDLVMAQNKDPEEDVVGIQFRQEERNQMVFLKDLLMWGGGGKERERGVFFSKTILICLNRGLCCSG